MWWECVNCRSKQPSTATVCLNCAAKAPPDVALPPKREQLPSFSHVLDTKSFILPVRRQILWIWIGIGFGLPLLMSAAYMAVAWLMK